MYILLAILMFGFLIFIHELGHFLSAKLLDVQVNELVAQDESYGSDFLGGQNDIALFCDLAKNIKFENNTIYDQLLNEGLQANWREYCKGTVTEDEAMSNFYKYINEKYPTIVTP